MCVLREDHGSKAASLVSKYTPNPDTQKWRVRYHTTCCVALYRSLVMEHQSKGSRFLFDGALSPLLSSLLLVKRDVVNSGVSKGTIGMPRRWNKCIFFLFILFFYFSPKSISGVEFESRAMKLRRSKWNELKCEFAKRKRGLFSRILSDEKLLDRYFLMNRENSVSHDLAFCTMKKSIRVM